MTRSSTALPDVDFPEDDSVEAWRCCLLGHRALLRALDTAADQEAFIAELVDIASQSGKKIFEDLLMAQIGRMVSIAGEDEIRRRMTEILDDKFWELHRRAGALALAATPLVSQMIDAGKQGPS